SVPSLDEGIFQMPTRPAVAAVTEMQIPGRRTRGLPRRFGVQLFDGMSGADRAGTDDRRAYRAEIRKRRVHVGIRAANENRERARARLLDGARGEGVDKPYIALPQFRRE